MKKLLLNLIIFFFLFSCGSSNIGKVLRNEKITNTDEFLVKKRKPLTMPPEYESLPKPGEIKVIDKDENKDIKNILKIPKEEASSTVKNSSVEEAIINEINK